MKQGSLKGLAFLLFGRVRKHPSTICTSTRGSTVTLVGKIRTIFFSSSKNELPRPLGETQYVRTVSFVIRFLSPLVAGEEMPRDGARRPPCLGPTRRARQAPGGGNRIDARPRTRERKSAALTTSRGMRASRPPRVGLDVHGRSFGCCYGPRSPRSPSGRSRARASA